MENMEETIEGITLVCDRIQQEIGKRIAEVVEHDLEGLTESMARMPLWTEKCFDSETAALIGVWDRLNSTVGDLLMLDNEDDDWEGDEDQMSLAEDDFFQAGVDAREATKERARATWKGQQKVIQLDPYSHPDEEANI